MSKRVLFGWVAMWLGTAIWIYGYFVKGHPALVHWQSFAPWWIADYLPNVESEIGMVLVWLSMLPIYWPSRATDGVDQNS